jgi:hypothetical protein
MHNNLFISGNSKGHYLILERENIILEGEKGVFRQPHVILIRCCLQWLHRVISFVQEHYN